MAELAASLVVGNPADPTTEVGPLVAQRQQERVNGYIEIGKQEGARVVTGGGPAQFDKGWFVTPTLFADANNQMRIAREEIFGPVLSVLTFRTPEEAIEKANNTPYGLSAGVWTEKGSRILLMTRRLKAGVVWANTFNRFDPTSPFGGYKESGFGREGGREGIEEYLAASEVHGPIIKLLAPRKGASANGDTQGIDRTAKLFIGGKQVRPDGNYSLQVLASNGKLAGEVGLGTRQRGIQVSRKTCHDGGRYPCRPEQARPRCD